MSKIRFTCPEIYRGIIPDPTPAVKCIPEYFRKLPLSHETGTPIANGTAKRCIPMLDALTQGFIISLCEDIIVIAKDGDINLYSEERFGFGIGTHNSEQLANHPRWDLPYGKLLWKFINPWIVTTEKNHSCLFTGPLNHLETRFKLMDGVVDTDTYHNQVNFPFIWTGGDGEFTLKKGTPLVQVIPFMREKYKLETGATDERKLTRTRLNLASIANNAYKTLFWHKRKDE
tara:strand:- start:3782 stop:4471 length:690 start_codon:yes stop_codon:yes gene_type:complete